MSRRASLPIFSRSANLYVASLVTRMGRLRFYTRLGLFRNIWWSPRSVHGYLAAHHAGPCREACANGQPGQAGDVSVVDRGSARSRHAQEDGLPMRLDALKILRQTQSEGATYRASSLPGPRISRCVTCAAAAASQLSRVRGASVASEDPGAEIAKVAHM
jgi:hypothetical protein